MLRSPNYQTAKNFRVYPRGENSRQSSLMLGFRFSQQKPAKGLTWGGPK
jgi:hypothetical protein